MMNQETIQFSAGATVSLVEDIESSNDLCDPATMAAGSCCCCCFSVSA